MRFSSHKHAAFIAGALITLLYIAYTYLGAHASILDTDAAKYALNIPFPHPPLGRWLMLASQYVFGATVFAARLPSLGADIVAFWIFLILAMRKRSWMVLMSFLMLAVNVWVLRWIGQGYQVSYMVAGIACIVYGFESGTTKREYWITGGYILSIWTQLQGVLLMPGIIAWYGYIFWKDRTAWHAQRLWISVFWILSQTMLVMLWFATSPAAIADAMNLAHRSSMLGLDRMKDLWASGLVGTAMICAVASIMAIVGIAQQWNEKRVCWMDHLVYVCVVIIALTYLWRNPAPYYLPYVYAFAAWALLRQTCSAMGVQYGFLMLCIAIWLVSASNVSSLHFAPSEGAWVMQQQVQDVIQRYDGYVMILGTPGYDWNYLGKQRFIRFTRREDIQREINVVIELSGAIHSEDEQWFLNTFTRAHQLKGVTVYER